ncbi:MAG: GtrA family protein [Lachnospiraceae bacterium]|nr:GtrA family protein [Lachnospiraceae bacterium]
MEKLIKQFIKFGAVGIFCFFIDYFTFKISSSLLGIHYVIASILGFTISVIVNYILSMKFVFEGKEDMSRRREFVIFVILSLIGLGLNTLILYICIDGIYMHSELLTDWLARDTAESLGKLGATAIVMVYNFITRKIFLEKKEG